MPLRVAALFEIPTPYRHPVFEQIAKRAEIEIDFYFLSRTQADRYWKPNFFDRLPATYLKGWQICFKGYHTIYLNRNVRSTLTRKPYDVFLLNGYAQPALWSMLRFCWSHRVPYVVM